MGFGRCSAGRESLIGCLVSIRCVGFGVAFVVVTGRAVDRVVTGGRYSLLCLTVARVVVDRAVVVVIGLRVVTVTGFGVERVVVTVFVAARVVVTTGLWVVFGGKYSSPRLDLRVVKSGLYVVFTVCDLVVTGF